MAQIKDLTKEQLWKLRQEITLNSLFVRDYENSLGIDPKECYTFFDGYVEYLGELAIDAENVNLQEITDSDYLDLAFKQDNKENLYNWFSCIKWED